MAVDLNEDDNSFWLCYEDVLKYFCTVNINFMRPPCPLPVKEGTIIGIPGSTEVCDWFVSRKSMTFTITEGEGEREREGEENGVREGIREGEGAVVNDSCVLAPYYVLTLLQPSEHVYVSLHQQSDSSLNGKPYIDFGVTILRIVPSMSRKGSYQLVTATGNVFRRQNQTESLSLPSGQYLIIPTSTGCNQKMFLEDFNLSSIAPCPFLKGSRSTEAYPAPIDAAVVAAAAVDVDVDAVVVDNDVRIGVDTNVDAVCAVQQGSENTPPDASVLRCHEEEVLIENETDGALLTNEENKMLTASDGTEHFDKYVVAAYSELFDRLDIDNDGYLNREELECFIALLEGTKYVLHEESYQWFLTTFDSDVRGLSRKGLIDCQLLAYRESKGGGVLELLSELCLLGYKRRHQAHCSCDLSCVTSRKVGMVVHTSSPHDLRARPHDIHLSGLAVEMALTTYGTEHVLSCCTLYVGSGGPRSRFISPPLGGEGVSFLVTNTCTESIRFHLDCTGSANIVSHRGQLQWIEEIPAGMSKVLHHLRSETFNSINHLHHY